MNSGTDAVTDVRDTKKNILLDQTFLRKFSGVYYEKLSRSVKFELDLMLIYIVLRHSLCLISLLSLLLIANL